MNVKSPCLTCDLIGQDKNRTRCEQCEKRFDYLGLIGDMSTGVHLELTDAGSSLKRTGNYSGYYQHKKVKDELKFEKTCGWPGCKIEIRAVADHCKRHATIVASRRSMYKRKGMSKDEYTPLLYLPIRNVGKPKKADH